MTCDGNATIKPATINAYNKYPRKYVHTEMAKPKEDVNFIVDIILKHNR
jgi:hypothetical protein